MSQASTTSAAEVRGAQNHAEEPMPDLGGRRLERRLFIALLGGTLLLTGWIASLVGDSQIIANIPAAIGAIIVFIPLAKGAFREMAKGQPAADSLASLAVIAAAATDQWLIAGFLALFLWLSELVLSRTAWGAQRAIRELVELTPDIARRINDNKEEEVSLAALKVGDIVRVRPGENLPVD